MSFFSGRPIKRRVCARTSAEEKEKEKEKLKLDQWASLKPFGKIINAVMIRSYELVKIGETGKNRAILKEEGRKKLCRIFVKNG